MSIFNGAVHVTSVPHLKCSVAVGAGCPIPIAQSVGTSIPVPVILDPNIILAIFSWLLHVSYGNAMLFQIIVLLDHSVIQVPAL